jgi:DHA1 family tetracycline resistance protein-like MFS transporter
MMFAFMVPFALGGIAMPAIQGIISNRVAANEQGEMQGAITSLISVTAIVGPVLMTELFYFFTQKNSSIYFPGAPFIMSSVLVAISLIIAAFTLKKIVKL